MSSLTAAELQQRLEGAPDPFPSLGDASSPSATKKQQQAALNTDSVEAFPSLGGPAPGKAAAPSMWSASSSKIKTPEPIRSSVNPSRSAAVKQPAGEMFELPSISLPTDKDGKLLTLASVMKIVKEKVNGASIEASTSKSSTTFMLKAPSAKALHQVKSLLSSMLSKVVTLTVDAPISTLGTIIGPKGTTLRMITDKHNVRINVPKRESAEPVNGHATTPGDEDEDGDEAEEPTVPVTIEGAESSAKEAQAMIQDIIGVRTSKTKKTIKDIPPSFFPFIAGPKGARTQKIEQEQGQGLVKIHIPPPAILKAFAAQAAIQDGQEEAPAANGTSKKDFNIIVTGEKAAVARVIEYIEFEYAELASTTTTLTMSVPKRQHRFLVGANADEILAATGCIVELPSIDDSSDACTIRGPSANLPQALTMVVTKANAVAVQTLDIGVVHRSFGSSFDPLAYGKSFIRYFVKSGRLRQLVNTYAPTKVFLPSDAQIDAANSVIIDIVGEDQAKVAKAKEELSAAVKALSPSTLLTVEIDYLIHKFLIGKKGQKLKQFNEAHGVDVIFPLESASSSDVLLVYTVEDASLPTERKARDAAISAKLAVVKDELEKLAKDAADIKTEVLNVDSKWHRHVIGTGGTVLNALIGEDKLVSIQVGADRRAEDKAEGADTITVRGPSEDVERVVKSISQIVEDAKNDDIINGHVAEFTIDKVYVKHLVGASGAAIIKLKEQLGVKVNFDDAETPASSEKKAKAKPIASGKAVVKIVGRKEAVVEAEKRILAQVERLADETTATIIVPKKYHAGLIGSAGKYAIRLEEKFGVKITFPRTDKETREGPSNPDEVQIRGGKKGVEAAKAELLEAAEYEKESNQTLTFTIPTRAVAKVLGKAGSQINEIKEETDAQIDVDKSSNKDTTITVRGTKKAIQAAKARILEISDTVAEETTLTSQIEQKHHRSIIGPGGSKLREIIVACGGPEEARQQAGLVQFPKAGDPENEVRFRGDPALVKKIKEALDKFAEELSSRIIVGVVVPQSQHASKIGRNGAALIDLQKRTGATVQFPGSRQYESFGVVSNPQDVEGANPKEIVKVGGPKAACDKAVEELSKQPENSQTSAPRRDQGESFTATVSVPIKLFHAISGQQGFFFRNLRNAGCNVDNPTPPALPPTPRPTKKADGASVTYGRIDQDEQPSSELDYFFEIFDRYAGLPEGAAEWTLRAKSQAALDKAQQMITDAIKSAETASSLGVLSGLQQSAFPRIVGSKGATVNRLRAETGADIQVPREGTDITITGDLASVEEARRAIVELAARPARY